MKSSRAAAKRPATDDVPIAPVTIFDPEGRVVRVVPATEFQRAAAAARAVPEADAPGDQDVPERLVRARRASEARSGVAVTASPAVQ